jgi:hypothetical protein
MRGLPGYVVQDRAFIPVPAFLILTHLRLVSYTETLDNQRTAAQPTGIRQPSSGGKCFYYLGGIIRALLCSSSHVCFGGRNPGTPSTDFTTTADTCQNFLREGRCDS